jgi:hypothetical protein
MHGGAAAVKLSFFPESPHCSGLDDALELLTLRYQTAFAQYRCLVDRNAGLNLSGARPSDLALYEEERAFDELDVARNALLEAAARAHPTVH